MNTLGFAGISGGLRPGRKKISRKKGAFKRVINDISGFSREAALPAAFLAEAESFRIAPRFTGQF
jgi:hypothetical protein